MLADLAQNLERNLDLGSLGCPCSTPAAPLQQIRITRCRSSATCGLRFGWAGEVAPSRPVTSPTVIELMTAFSQPFTGPAAAVPASELLRRKPQRVTATLPWHLVHRLEERASYEGRSLSNLIAHLLEVAG